MWCIGQITGEYLARLEDVLSLYHLPYDERRPVICLDELPFQMLGEKVEPLLMKPSAPRKFDYEYERKGVASVFVAFEPLTGKRLVKVYPRRTKADYCRFQQAVSKHWSGAEVIVQVQDNLNTHHASSFYENLPPAEAYSLMKRFEFHYTPKKASWLNIAELELSALARQCLARRIPDIETLGSELESVVKERNKLEVKVKWQFTIENAREKLNRHYQNVVAKLRLQSTSSSGKNTKLIKPNPRGCGFIKRLSAKNYQSLVRRIVMRKIFLIFAVLIALSGSSLAQGSGFSFQGRLNDGTNPANGQYDLQFRLYNAATGGAQINSTVARPGTVLINGVFSTTLDFGAAAFNNPSSVFIEIGVKPAGSPNAYTILGPRQQLTIVPFAVRANNSMNADFAINATNAQNAVNATNATNATNAATATNALSLGGVPAASYAQLNVINTGDLRTNGAIAVTGNAFQPIGSKGFAKAMIEVSGSTTTGTIIRCYNLITNSSTGNCGFTITKPLEGVYRINFGFPVTNSFVAVTSQYTTLGINNNTGVNYRYFDNTSIEFFTFRPDSTDTSNGANFTVILF